MFIGFWLNCVGCHPRERGSIKMNTHNHRKFGFRKIVSGFILLAFLTGQIFTPAIGLAADGLGTPSDIASSVAQAQALPLPGTSIGLTAGFQPPVLLGLKVHPENPLLFDFIVDQGQSQLSQDELKSETEKLVKYFLTALTIPDKEVWVNLSPYEKDRIIPDVLGSTTMGKTMLEQDYILKQLAASLTNPDTDLGRKFWDDVKRHTPRPDGLGTPSDVLSSVADVPMNTFNRVWIVPQKAEVLESNGVVLVGEKRLKLMMDQDYVAMKNVQGLDDKTKDVSKISSNIFKETILPNIEKEINEGKNFANVRQIYNSVILAAWYKKALKESLLGKVYTDKGKVAGVETDDKEMKQRIYEQYLEAFKKGVYNLIKEEENSDGEMIPRKYFSGGIAGFGAVGSSALTERAITLDQAAIQIAGSSAFVARVYGATEEKELQAVHGAMAANDERFAASSGVNWREIHQDMVQVMRAIIGNRAVSDLSLLDLGAGNGFGVSLEMAKWHWGRSIFVDNSTENIDSFESTLQTQESEPDKNRRFIVDDMRKVVATLPDASLDIIHAHLSLHYFNRADTLELFSRLRKLLKPGGVLVFRVRSAEGWDPQTLSEWQKSETEDNFYQRKDRAGKISGTEDMHLFSSEEIDTLLSNVGLTIVSKNLTEIAGWDNRPWLVIATSVGKLGQTVSAPTATVVTSSSLDIEKLTTIATAIGRDLAARTIDFSESAIESKYQIQRLENEKDVYKLKLGDNEVVIKYFHRSLHSSVFDRQLKGLQLMQGNPLFQQYIAHNNNDSHGLPWIASYYVRGESAKNVNQRAKFSPQQQIDYYLSVGKKIELIPDVHWDQLIGIFVTAEEKGIAFDHNPNNFLYDPDRGFVVIDFSEGLPTSFHLDLEAVRRYLYNAVPIIIAGYPAKIEQAQLIVIKSKIDERLKALGAQREAAGPTATPGGIDFDPANMNLQIKRDGKGVPLPLPQQNLDQINIEGLFPVIINIVPVNAQTLPIFLGQAPKEPAREPELAASSAG